MWAFRLFGFVYLIGEVSNDMLGVCVHVRAYVYACACACACACAYMCVCVRVHVVFKNTYAPQPSSSNSCLLVYCMQNVGDQLHSL